MEIETEMETDAEITIRACSQATETLAQVHTHAETRKAIVTRTRTIAGTDTLKNTDTCPRRACGSSHVHVFMHRREHVLATARETDHRL